MGNPNKTVFFGPEKSGKTAILRKRINGRFSETYKPDEGVNIYENTVAGLKLRLFDCPSNEKSKTMSSMFYENAKVGVCVFDVTDPNGLNSASEDVKKFQETNGVKTPIILVGNKTDLEEARVVTEAAAEAKAEALGLTYCECSAKTGDGVKELFAEIERVAVQDQPDSSTQAVKQSNSYAGVSFFRICKTYIEKNGNRLRALDIFRSAFFTDQFLTQEDKRRIVDTINQRAKDKDAENSASAATLEVYPGLRI